jgi:hypothetical protein
MDNPAGRLPSLSPMDSQTCPQTTQRNEHVLVALR